MNSKTIIEIQKQDLALIHSIHYVNFQSMSFLMFSTNEVLSRVQTTDSGMVQAKCKLHFVCRTLKTVATRLQLILRNELTIEP